MPQFLRPPTVDSRSKIVLKQGLPMRKLSPADRAALRAMHQAARNPRLEAALAEYEHLRLRGVGHEEAVARAVYFANEDAGYGH
jgi:hypothetical protein